MRRPSFPTDKAPQVVRDLISDLRDRHLLPVVVGLALAIVAVPVILSNSGSSGSPATQSHAAVTEPAKSAKHLTVTAEDPGLRNYRKRLDRLSSKDPFKQQYQTPITKAAELGTSLSTAVGGGSTGTSVTPGPVPTGTGGGTPVGKTKPAKPEKVVSYTINVFTGPTGSLKRRTGVEPLTPLPSAFRPVALFLDATSDGRQALFVISSQAALHRTDGSCVMKDDGACQVLALRPGGVAGFTYAGDSKIYKIKLVKITPVTG
jgi:hypothetical protein